MVMLLKLENTEKEESIKLKLKEKATLNSWYLTLTTWEILLIFDK